MKTPYARTIIKKRSIVIEGNKSSISLERAFWREFKRIAGRRKLTLSQLVSEIAATHGPDQNRSSAVRVFILEDVRVRARRSKALARDNSIRAASLEKQIRAMRAYGNEVKDGHAPIAAVIAGGRANG